MASLAEFHEDFLQSILADTESRGILKAQSFFELTCDSLSDAGDLTDNYTPADYYKKGVEVSGFDYDEERMILTLINFQFFQENNIQTLTKEIIETKFNRLIKFYQDCNNRIFKNIEETSDAYGMAYTIYGYIQGNKIEKIRLMVLTDGKVTRNLTDLPSKEIKGTHYEYRVIDIEYLHKFYESRSSSTVFEVNVDLPCLKINDEHNSYQSYLTVVTGDTLVKIYEDFGQRLFEQNVRTFLQFKGGVNKGIRNTIEYNPEMFFAYNNGITATAASVELDEQTGNLRKIHNFQIVNGGQTTSAIYAASKSPSHLKVDGISVQMKLSVVKNSVNEDEFVSKVAEYANTQNKINSSDFFSNSPFHKEMKEHSGRKLAPAIDGSQLLTRWFYERVRGEYLNNQAYRTSEAKRKFLLENPKKQVVDKTLLSKTENLWLQKPDIVSKGAQESFKKFAIHISEKLEKNNLAITDTYFCDAISRVILFRTTERIVTNSVWYNGGFRAQIVAYTISYLSSFIESKGLFLNFDLIWKSQKLPKPLEDMLILISEKMYNYITNPPSGQANISQWAKKSDCWESAKKITIDFRNWDDTIFISEEKLKFIVKEAKEVKAIDKAIDREVFVLNVDMEAWKKLQAFYKDRKGRRNLSDMETDILNKKADGRILTASERQAKILYGIFQDAVKDGFSIS